MNLTMIEHFLIRIIRESEDFSKVKGKLIESPDFEKIEDEKRLEQINKEFPSYRKVKAQEGFMQILEISLDGYVIITGVMILYFGRMHYSPFVHK